ncbi:MAG TPA: 16S rRNA (guanine(527)-N(7))-methyltransferase RsmG, partial [Firmicutes bacterium]|nr:16S rRNA (guanine(527)-N(7))-methyltransferase RsmG [Bacillota bacterium]
MSEEMFIEELKKIGVELSPIQLGLFRKYADFLLEYNKHTNLTAIRNREDI